MRKYIQGVTLIELMMVVAIVAIIGAFAIPSYRDYVVRAHRADAQMVLMQIAAAQEKFYLANNSYCADADMADDPPDGLGIAATSEHGYYDVEIDDGAFDLAVGYRAQVTAVGGQLDGDPDCKYLTIDHRGVKYGGTSPGTPSSNNPKCWGK